MADVAWPLMRIVHRLIVNRAAHLAVGLRRLFRRAEAAARTDGARGQAAGRSGGRGEAGGEAVDAVTEFGEGLVEAFGVAGRDRVGD